MPRLKRQGTKPDNDTQVLLPGRYRAQLLNHEQIHREACRLYRECRSGLIDTQDCSRLVFVLKTIASLLEGGELEKRIEALENGVPHNVIQQSSEQIEAA